MFRRLNKVFFPFFTAFPLLCCACAFADLRPVDISTVPDVPDALLPKAESPVVVVFDTEMEKPSVEKAFQIFSPDGIAEGEFRWEGYDLYFHPLVPWKPGLRYTLRLSGTVFAEDGRELLLSEDIPFYAVSRSSLPYVKSFSPLDGESVGAVRDIVLVLNFSLPMNRLSTEDALSLDIPGEKIYEWLDDDKTLRVSSDKPLNPWVPCRWSVSSGARSRDGAPLAKEVSGRFITDLEKDFLRVVKLIPLMPPEPFPEEPLQDDALWRTWVPAGTSLRRGPGHGQGIGVAFNKSAESESLRRAFSFTPPLPGRVEILSPVSAVFIPSKDPEPETVYSLRISGSVKDSGGLKMGEDFLVSFTPDIPWLEVLSVSSGEDEENTASENGGTFSVQVNSGGIVRCCVNFSLSIDPAVREKCALAVLLRPFFPETLPPVSLRSALWISTDKLLLEWEGPEGGRPDKPHYCKLLIPGASGGVHNGRGSYLKEDFYLYLEVTDE